MTGCKRFPILVPRPCTDLLTATSGGSATIGHKICSENCRHDSLTTRLDHFPSSHLSAAFTTNLDSNLWAPVAKEFREDWTSCEQRDQYYNTPTLTWGQSDTESSCLDHKPISVAQLRWSDVSSDTQSRVRDWYKHAFGAMHQTVCKRVAKIWIAAIEPGKVAVCPYQRDVKGGKREQPPPKWWPPAVQFKGPDRLHTNGRPFPSVGLSIDLTKQIVSYFCSTFW